jgi:gamma-glutamyltranspeptidase/glutathione hydrolase
MMRNTPPTDSKLLRAALAPLMFLLALCAGTPAFADDERDGRRAAPVPTLQHTGAGFRQGVVSVSHPLAAQAGARVLEQGGNAIDAAAAVQFVLNVVEPQFSGIGGGGFMMVHLARHDQTFAIDGRERAPAAASPRMFLFGGVPAAFGLASTSGISVGVPGTLAVLDTALKHYGTISLAEALQPAITLADNGFRINKFLAANIAGDGGITSLQPETKAVFRPGGVPLADGDLLVQKDLAKTFRLIAQKGADVFYHGEIAQAIVNAQRRSRSPVAAEGAGRMELSDLAAYRTEIRQPITGNYRGYQIASMSPPSSGGLTIIQMLKMLERFPLGDAAQGYGFGATKTMHVMMEAMRLAFADRAVWMGDEDFVHVPKKGLLDPTYVASRAAMINLNTRMTTPAAGNPLPFDVAGVAKKTRIAAIPFEEEKGIYTTHFSIVDKWGNVVSYTTTIEQTWGSGIMVPGYGFLLNNELTDFNFTPTFDATTGNPGANDVAPFKRPRSSMSPTIVFRKGEPVAAYGSPGGSTIINSVLNTTLNLIDHKMTIQDAINAPRLSVTSAAGAVSCEGGQPFMTPAFSQTTLDALRFTLLHPVPLVPTVGGVPTCASTIGSVQGLVIDLKTGRQFGGADQRREGTVIGVKRSRGHHDDDDD